MKKIAILLAGTLATAAFSHENHGLTGSHWHSSDVWSFVVLAVALTLLVAGRSK
jgi:hypothetical protein